MRKKGFFVTLEGPDGCGKTTQAKLLARFLRSLGLEVVHTREPGGTSFAEGLRRIILDSRRNIAPLSELLLYEAARAQHTEEIIKPAIRAGKVVMSERYADATVAYQGHGRRLDLNMIRGLNAVATGGLLPDLTLVLDIPENVGLKRARKAKRGNADRLEREAASFHRRVRAGYYAIARREPRRVQIVSAAGGIEEVHERIKERISKRLKRKAGR